MLLRELKNKKVTVMGLGRSGGGVEVVKFLAMQGADVLVTDIKKTEELPDSLSAIKNLPRVEIILGQHRKEDFVERDFIIKNPGVPKKSPYLAIARQHNIPIKTDISLFFQLSPAPIIGITGTKGKSTTASLIIEFLKTNYDAHLAGNIGISPLGLLHKINPNSIIVLELSSWQLEDIESFALSPHVGVVLNIYPDHLNRHPDISDYIRAKKNIVRFGTKKDIAVLNYDDPAVKEFSSDVSGKVYFFSEVFQTNGAYMKEEGIYFGEDEEYIVAKNDILIKGDHAILNILAAVSIAKLYKIKNKEIKKILGTFKGIPYRQEFIREIHGISFYNDTTATIPQATIAALKRFEKNIILIAGGMDKNLDYTDLAKEIKRRVKYVILLPGSATEKIEKSMKEQGVSIKVTNVNDMEEAVRKAFKEARMGDSIVLSPAATSFNIFKNEFDRGEQFNKVVAAL